jgi:PadR family transcriptional regulator PadR
MGILAGTYSLCAGFSQRAALVMWAENEVRLPRREFERHVAICPAPAACFFWHSSISYLDLQGIERTAVASPNPNFMAGIPELMILRLLDEREMYGYEIVQAIRVGTSDIVTLGEGVVYPVLHGLERDGALKSRSKLVAGRNRVYYTLTANGRRRFAALDQTWTTLTEAVNTMLRKKSHGSTV